MKEEMKTQKKLNRDLKKKHTRALNNNKKMKQNLGKAKQGFAKQTKVVQKVNAKVSSSGIAKSSLRRKLNNKLDEVAKLKAQIKELEEENDRLKNKRGDVKIMTNK